ncbi:hypothetical protein HMPREF0027_1630 [Actinobacillus ureae ATCC 25976]|uniref:Uncharacterized protein n=2 Tax=Actinobacillus ureae TaxID=723 RepID=E8KIG3_9PAST|nr:hypothetical protein HMPREF0027_1630 [Actinobacillus ureae ATCC 25976]
MTSISVANQSCLSPYAEALPKYEYTLNKVMEVNGRQGVTTDGKYLYVSGSASLAKYDLNGKLITENKKRLSVIKKKPIISVISIFITMNYIFPLNGLWTV